ncbi:MAG: hypothetical protein ACI4RH_07875 [Huintestinicola sp.]
MMERLINGVIYVSNANKVVEALSVVNICLLLVCGVYLSLRNMILKLADEEGIITKKSLLTALNIAFAIGIVGSGAYGIYCYNDMPDKYIVNVSSDVDMEEFLDTYEVVEYNDNDRTFTIKVREQ